MRKNCVTTITLLVVVILTVLNPSAEASGDWKTHYYKLKMELLNRGSSNYILTFEDRLFFIFPNTSTQRVYIFETYPAVERILKDEDGNLLAELNLPEKIEPGGNITVTIIIMVNITLRNLPEISIDSSGSFSDIPAELANYTVSSGAWRYEDEGLKYIADLAAQIKGNDTNILRVVSKMVEFIGSRVRYPGGEELRPPQYPNQTLPRTGKMGWGDCDDQSALLIVMLRSVGIPSYLQTGGVVSPFYSISGETWDGHLTVVSRGIGWHGWVEAYVPPWGWLPVDITYGYYSHREDPLSSIRYSASARELMLESERYSTIDFVEEYLKTERRIRGSSLYVHMEEDVSEKPFSDGDSHLVGQPEETTVLLALCLVTLIVSVAMLIVLLRRAGPRRVEQYADQILLSTIATHREGL